MSWVTAHFALIVMCLTLLGTVAGGLANLFPAGSTAQKVSMFFARVLPGDVVNAVKEVAGAPAAPLAAKRGFVDVRALCVVTGITLATIVGVCALTGCPAAATAAPVVVDVAVCVIETTAADVAQNVPAPQVVADDIAKCGADLPSIASILDAEAKSNAVVGDAGVKAAKFAEVAAAARASDAGAADAGH